MGTNNWYVRGNSYFYQFRRYQKFTLYKNPSVCEGEILCEQIDELAKLKLSKINIIEPHFLKIEPILNYMDMVPSQLILQFLR